CSGALRSRLYGGLDRSGSRAARAHGAYPFDGRNHRRPTAIFLGQPVAVPSSVGSNHYPRATTAPVSRSACSSTPALWARSNDEAAWGNRPLKKISTDVLRA